MAMGRTVAELEATLDSAELSEWRAFELLEPFGSARADSRAWLGVAMLANLHRGQREPLDLHAVLPAWTPPAPAPDAAMAAQVEAKRRWWARQQELAERAMLGGRA